MIPLQIQWNLFFSVETLSTGNLFYLTFSFFSNQ